MKKTISLFLAALLLCVLAACSKEPQGLQEQTVEKSVFTFVVKDLLEGRDVINKDNLKVMDGATTLGKPVDLEKMTEGKIIYGGVGDKSYKSYDELLNAKEESYSKTLSSDDSFGGFKYIELRGPYNATYEEQLAAGQWNLVDSDVDLNRVFCIEYNEPLTAEGQAQGQSTNQEIASQDKRKTYDVFEVNKNALSSVLDKFGRPDNLYIFPSNEDAFSLFDEGVEYGDQNNSNTHILYIVAVLGTSEGRIYLNIEDRLTLNSDAKASKTTSDEELYFSAVTYVPKTQFKERDEINENSIDYFNR